MRPDRGASADVWALSGRMDDGGWREPLRPSAASSGDPLRATEACGALMCAASAPAVLAGQPGVDVGPDGAALVEQTAATRTMSFTVRNTGAATATFALTAECRDAQGQRMTPCASPAATPPLPANGTTAVTATYPATQAGGMVTVLLRAAQADAPGVHDAGWTDVALRTGSGAAGVPLVSLVPLNAGGDVERGLCVTVATASRGAYECGDLRIAHGLPVHRTRGRTWAPALLYNSQHASPRPIVYADVTVPGGDARLGGDGGADAGRLYAPRHVRGQRLFAGDGAAHRRAVGRAAVAHGPVRVHGAGHRPLPGRPAGGTRATRARWPW